MAGSDRTSSRAIALRAELAEDPYRFEFYQAIRLLDALHTDLPRLGEASRARQEAIRLGNEPSLAFPTSTLASFTPGEDDKKDKLDVRFFGLFGPNGPMPLHLTEYVRGRLHQERDRTFKEFADVFHHRMLSLLYRAWANARPTASYDRPEQDKFFEYVAALIGVDTPGALARDALADHTRTYFAGLLAMQNRPATGLRAMVEDYLQVTTEIVEFVGEWLRIPDDARCLLGYSVDSGTLGASATAGAYTWYCQGKFRLVCGPMRYVDFARLLPDRVSLPPLAALVRQYAGDELGWELQLVLVAQEVPAAVLGEHGQLGWTTWLGERQSRDDADDVVLRPAALVHGLGVDARTTGREANTMGGEADGGN